MNHVMSTIITRMMVVVILYNIKVKKMYDLKKFIQHCLYKYVYCNDTFREYVHYRQILKSGYLLINEKYIQECTYLSSDNFKFKVSDCMEHIDSVLNDYDFKINNDHVVVDIGANIGAFAIRAAKKCKHVYAIEPLFVSELRKNFELNEIQNDKYTIIPFGINNFKKLSCIKYGTKHKDVVCITFNELKKIIGTKIDYLKMDCEGIEWSLTESDLQGINKIEMELHCFKHENPNDFLKKLTDFNYSIIKITENTYIIHAIKI